MGADAAWKVFPSFSFPIEVVRVWPGESFSFFFVAALVWPGENSSLLKSFSNRTLDIFFSGRILVGRLTICWRCSLRRAGGVAKILAAAAVAG